MKKNLLMWLAGVVFLLSGLFFWNLSREVVQVSETGAAVRLPILMYHGVTRREAAVSTYVIHEERLKEDIEYLKDHGYTAVLPGDILRWSAGERTLPEKPVLLTFDDGGLCMLDYVLPILQESGYSALCAVVGDFMQEEDGEIYRSPEYSSMRAEEVDQLNQSPRIEIAAHSMYMHSMDGRRGTRRKKNESVEDYIAVFLQDTKELHKMLLPYGIVPVVYAYPYGEVSEESVQVLKDLGYQMTLLCAEGINTLYPGQELFGLMRFNRPGEMSTAAFMKKAGIH